MVLKRFLKNVINRKEPNLTDKQYHFIIHILRSNWTLEISLVLEAEILFHISTPIQSLKSRNTEAKITTIVTSVLFLIWQLPPDTRTLPYSATYWLLSCPQSSLLMNLLPYYQ